jgi:hypothetical protein
VHDFSSLQKYLETLQPNGFNAEYTYLITADVKKLEQLNKQYLQALANFDEPEISRQEFEQQLEACLLDTKAGEELQQRMLSIADELERKSEAGLIKRIFFKLQFTFRR